MARMNKRLDDANISGKVSSPERNKSSVSELKPGAQTSSDALAAGKSTVTPLLTHKQIEERAKAIWRQKGCPVGQDEKNWLEAENQLKRELAAK